ncbi:MAG TPA: aminotransferase class I/II-fold pyridoxal phosphate-dependent enzyme [Tepidisphaeraceae bacterium]|nr:aminotransferase class I/II-fold pyridoxal phosphate-dependent enzyme [Tepidisphaeraceae bacterium]
MAAQACGEKGTTTFDDLFGVIEGRRDRWQQLHGLGQAWIAAEAAAKPGEGIVSEARELLAELEPIETYFAYPGALATQVAQDLEAGNARDFARLTRSIARSLLGSSYRRGIGHDRPDKSAADASLLRVPDYAANGREEPLYFELLVVGVGEPESQKRVRHELRRLRRHDDPFHYEPVFVPSFEDAALATIFNFDVQAVVIYDGFPFSSQLGLGTLGEYLGRHLEMKPEQIESASHGIALAEWIYRCRPQLDVYLLTDKAPESLACRLNTQIVRRVFYDVEEFMEIHLAILEGVGQRYATPYFDNLKKYARTPVGTFHALPIARGKSVFKSHWIRDMGEFYGTNLFLAESSATTGGLDSLLEPTGNIRLAQEKAARAFGADRCYFATNGTSTSNKIVSQALCRPGDICLADRNCHKSHHYGFVLAGAEVIYLEAFPLTQYSMYGAVPIATITRALNELKEAGKLDRVRMITLTNCTFDGHMYNVKRVMRECLAIKPDLIFLWDEAWFGFARFDPLHRRRSAMHAAQELRKELAGRARIRVYETNSTHKSMSALRQGSMILVADDDFVEVQEPFEEAYMTHTSTSPNLQIIATIDLARRQMELEGYELTMKMTALAMQIRRQINGHPLISKYFRALTPAEMIPGAFRESGVADYPPAVRWDQMLDAWESDEVALDPTRVTITCGAAGFDGTQFKTLLAERFDIQLNKTSRNSVLVQTNINNTRSDGAHLIQVLCEIASEIDDGQIRATRARQEEFGRRVESLTRDVPELPDFSRFHDAFRADPPGKTPEGLIRDAFYMGYRSEYCEHVALNSEEIDRRLEKGPELVSANFVIPYPPGFPIMVPGQVISREIVTFMRKLDVHEIHGYHAALGLKVFKPTALEQRHQNAPRDERPRDRGRVQSRFPGETELPERAKAATKQEPAETGR